MTTCPEAILWDFDGTLVDSEGVWLDVETGIATELGAHLPEGYQAELVGQSLIHTAEYILQFAPNCTLTPPEVVEWMVDGVVKAIVEDGVHFLPGVLELLAEARAAQIPQAIVSMSYRRIIDAVVAEADLGFAAIVCGDDVERGKPDPQAYLMAAEMLKVDPRRCVAIEDSPTGSTAAVAAGCVTLAVPSELPVSTPGARVLETLAGVSLADVRVWCDAAQS